MKVNQVLSKVVFPSLVIVAFLYGTGLIFNFIDNVQLSNPFMTESTQVERRT